MGKNLKGKSIGCGICQRKDGIYQASLKKPQNNYSTGMYNIQT